MEGVSQFSLSLTLQLGEEVDGLGGTAFPCV